MSEISDMIQRLCPDGVEYRKLGEVCEILDSQRKPVSKGKRNAGKYPYYGANGIQDYVDNYIFNGTFLLIGEDGSVINADKSPVINWATGKIWVNNHAHILSELINIAYLRYLYYVLQTVDVSNIVRGTPPKLNQANLREIEIPVPPLEVQRKIVEYLDNFSELTAELEAELEARKKQYEYYRDNLLNFSQIAPPNSVKWMKLGEIASINRGIRVTKGDLSENGFPVFQNCLTPMGYYHEYNCKENTPFIICGGAAGNVGYTFEKCWAADDCEYIVGTDEVLNRYIYYFLMSKQDFLKSKVRKASIPRLSPQIIKNLLIPIPPLHEQERIVSILDRFEALTTDLTSGLPAEIKARQQQYEYYRDQLLTFKRAN